jgi:hypothetical protein
LTKVENASGRNLLKSATADRFPPPHDIKVAKITRFELSDYAA